MSVTALRSSVLSQLGTVLREHGFRRAGTTFWREFSGVVQLINVQSSTDSTQGNLRFTVNIGVSCLGALRSWDSPRSVASSHWRHRLGNLAGLGDHWWSVSDALQASSAADQVSQLLVAHVMPELERLSSVGAMIQSLRGHGGHGLTAFEQQQLLARLEALPLPA